MRGFLELRVEEEVPEADTTVLVMCAGGVRSLFAAEGLQNLGYEDVRGRKADIVYVSITGVLVYLVLYHWNPAPGA